MLRRAAARRTSLGAFAPLGTRSSLDAAAPTHSGVARDAARAADAGVARRTLSALGGGAAGPPALGPTGTPLRPRAAGAPRGRVAAAARAAGGEEAAEHTCL